MEATVSTRLEFVEDWAVAMNPAEYETEVDRKEALRAKARRSLKRREREWSRQAYLDECAKTRPGPDVENGTAGDWAIA